MTLQRRARQTPSLLRSRALAASLTLHVALLVSILAGPALFADRPPRLEYAEVMLVPAAALRPGPTPRPAAAAPPQAAPPQPAVETPLPTPKPPPDDAPVLPKPPDKKPPPSKPAAEPTRAPDAAKPVPDPSPPKAPDSQGDRATGSPAVDPRLVAASTGKSESSSLASFVDPDFVYSYYLDRMVQLINQYWQPPPLNRPIECTVGFRIHSDGAVVDLRVVVSSGLQSFDAAALRAVQSASPMPPLPRGYQKPSLGVNLIVRNLGDSPR